MRLVVMRSLVVCICFLQSFMVLAENFDSYQNGNNPYFSEKSFAFFYSNPFPNLNHQHNNTLSTISDFKKLTFTHIKSLFKPAIFQKQNQVSLHYLHLGQHYPLSFDENTRLYSGAGVTYFDSENGYYNDDTSFSFSLGVQSNYQLKNNLTIKLDSKLFGTYFDGKNNRYCVEDVCQLSQSNEFWIQKQVSVNITYSF